MGKLSLVGDKPDSMHSPVALTFDAEIKRVSAEKGLEIGKVMKKLAAATGLEERHLYNYRSGKTDIPSLLIPILCKQFESNALAMTVIGLCDDCSFDERDAFDLAKFCTGTIRNMLKGGEDFLDAFEDNRIDGHELIRLKNTRALIVRDANRMLEVAVHAHERRVA
jgi:hypothetical protein